MLPVVAIVGQPNVGKSTLFNCLTKSRSALVSDIPGMTRDRQYGDALYNDRHFIVIDTGGLTQEDEPLHQLTCEQAVEAIKEADKVIFLVDGKLGLTSNDEWIANKLRTYNKHIFLTINKTENIDAHLVDTEFHKLGLGNPIAISAAHKQGITELVNALFLHDPITDIPEDKTAGVKLALIGRPNVGKSTLTNRLLGENRVIVFDQPGTTRDTLFIPLMHKNHQYTLIDTAGIRRRGKIFEGPEKFSVVKTLQAITLAHVVLFVMDAHEGVTEQDLRLIGFILESGRALVIAMNKWDGMTIYDKKTIKAAIDRRLNFIPFVRVHYISALHGSGTGALFSSINEAYQSATKKISTASVTKILQTAITQHTPPRVRGRRIKLRYAHPGGHNPPTIVIHGNQLTALPESYVKYLANTFQKYLRLTGTPIRIELKNTDNPFRHQREKLTPLQRHKKNKLIKRRSKRE